MYIVTQKIRVGVKHNNSATSDSVYLSKIKKVLEKVCKLQRPEN